MKEEAGDRLSDEQKKSLLAESDSESENNSEVEEMKQDIQRWEQGEYTLFTSEDDSSSSDEDDSDTDVVESVNSGDERSNHAKARKTQASNAWIDRTR